MKAYKDIMLQLRSLKLIGVQNHLDELVSEAEAQKHSYLSFLKGLLSYELEHRNERRYRRNITAAHFPVIKLIKEFDFNHVSGITKTETAGLLDFHWIDKMENVLFFGPPGLGNYVSYRVM